MHAPFSMFEKRRPFKKIINRYRIIRYNKRIMCCFVVPAATPCADLEGGGGGGESLDPPEK